ncbi:MAG TPA: pyruvate ferredoxin oxidoreductase [Planctomycetes bacterium]|nr:pyruvate ferredoxin oxidoreductase [Planctomycetota bacterium]
MLEIRLNGRGGQGTMVAAKILAVAAARERLHVQAFPEFGVERRGASVCAYVRIAREPIYERGRILRPDHLMVLDPALLDRPDLAQNVDAGGWIVMNTRLAPDACRARFDGFKTAAIDANSLAIAHQLGSRFAPFVNSVMLGAFVRAVPFVACDTLCAAIRDNSPAKPDANVAAALQAYREVQLAATAEAVWATR